MPRVEPEFTYSQPVWWLARQPLSGFGAKRTFGEGAFGVEGNLFGDGVFGGAAFGDGTFGDGVFGGAEPFGGWQGFPGVFKVQVADTFGGGNFGDNLFGDVRPSPNPFIDFGLGNGASPFDDRSLDSQFQLPQGAPRYPVFGGGPCALPDGSTFIYGDQAFPHGARNITQGDAFYLLKGSVNVTSTSPLYDPINYRVSLHAILPMWPYARRFRVIYRWVASAAGWFDWDGVTVPAGATLFEAFADLGDNGCGTPWPVVTGSWPVELTVGGVTSRCPSGGAFSIRS